MKTSAEIRRERLEVLIAEAGSIANLNERLGRPRNDPKLSQIRNAVSRGEANSKPHQMGDAMARQIETALKLERGWMDNPITWGERSNMDRQLSHAVLVMEQMPDYLRTQAIKIIDTLAESPVNPPGGAAPAPERNGTTV